MSDLLEPILRRVRSDVARRKRKAMLERLLDRSAVAAAGNLGAVDALRRPPEAKVRAIAEIKFRSPSAGVLRSRTTGDVAGLARSYAAAGAAAVSVLTERVGFGGGALDVRRAHRAVSVPILFKGFVIDELQLALARLTGASLVLLLVRVLDRDRLFQLTNAARAMGLEPVVEAKDAAELDVALETSAPIVGINARDLGTFRVDPETARRQLERVPEHRVAVLMSGVRNAQDVRAANAARADALLIGETLMRAPDPGAKLLELLGNDGDR